MSKTDPKPLVVNPDPLAGSPAVSGDHPTVTYKTTKPINIEFDILIKGETIMGAKGEEKGHIYFEVPKELVEYFEMHYHFKVGNVVAVTPKLAA